MEEFKKIEEILQPDERNLFFVVLNNDTGEQRPLCMEDIYRPVEAIILKDSVPNDIKSQFNVAKNLSVYSWFSYSFHQTSDLKAFSTVEYALRVALGKKKEALGKLLELAVSKCLLWDRGFSHLVEDAAYPDAWVKQLPIFLPKLRNSLAHGSSTLYPGSVFNLRMCADLINQLF